LSVVQSNAGTTSISVIAPPPVATSPTITIHDPSASTDYPAATAPFTTDSGAMRWSPAKYASAQVLDGVFADFGDDVFEEAPLMVRTIPGL
jgi:hypothetical protein